MQKENELKEKRYFCIVLLMYTLIKPDEMETLSELRPKIENMSDLKRELQTEWINTWIYADDNTIESLREFLDNPDEKTFAKTILSMRKEL